MCLAVKRGEIRHRSLLTNFYLLPLRRVPQPPQQRRRHLRVDPRDRFRRQLRRILERHRPAARGGAPAAQHCSTMGDGWRGGGGGAAAAATAGALRLSPAAWLRRLARRRGDSTARATASSLPSQHLRRVGWRRINPHSHARRLSSSLTSSIRTYSTRSPPPKSAPSEATCRGEGRG